MNIEQFSGSLVNGTGETVKIIGLFGVAATAVLGLRELTAGSVDSFVGIVNMTSAKEQRRQVQQEHRDFQTLFSNIGRRLADRGTTYGLIFLLGLGSVALLKIGGGLQGERITTFFNPSE